MPASLDDLAVLANEVRATIELLAESRNPVVRRIERFLQAKGRKVRFDFPHNWCDFATCVLAGHISREIHDEVSICIAWVSEPGLLGRHWWVRYGDIDIDITSHQFADAPKEAIVASRSEWHARRFEEASPYAASSRPLMVCRFELFAKALEVRVDDATRESRACRAIAKCLGH
jgi:hypothetical protein